MNESMRNSDMVDLEQSLRTLAQEDSHQQAPPHVHAAVMRTWDAVRPFADHRRRARRRAVLFLGIGAMAATLAAVVVLRPDPERSQPQPIVEQLAERAPVGSNAPPPGATTASKTEPARRRPPHRPVGITASRHEQGVVLLGDPVLDASTTTIVRVRVSRAALVTLGIAPVEPDDEGSVELEMLVAEDGVAQTIRRATPVAVSQE
jgi:hypothetical protein